MVQSHRRHSFSVGCGGEGSYHCDEREDAQHSSNGFGMAKGFAIRQGRGVTANFAFRTVGEYPQYDLAFEVGNIVGQAGDDGNVLFVERDVTIR
jgi:hypothetical protein